MQLIAAALALITLVQATPSFVTPQSLAEARKHRTSRVPRAACKVPTYMAGPVDDSLPAFDADKAVIFRNRKQQAVNVGNL